jgi:hypothetical protein
MSTIKIEGTFSGSVNNHVRLDIYRPNPDSYDFSKHHGESFTETLTDLRPGESYFFDITGYTAGGSFNITVTGDIVTNINETFSNNFKPGLVIATKPA